MPESTKKSPRDISIEILDWDTEFFGFRVARILPPRLNEAELRAIMSELREENVSLAYWGSDSSSSTSKESGLSAGGALVDNKVTYVLDLRKVDPDETRASQRIHKYSSRQCSEELEALAIECGGHSRFRVDPLIPNEQFEELFKVWMRRSVSKEIANSVWVADDENAGLSGVVTTRTTGGRGAIGLLAVHPHSQGKGLGRALVRAASSEFIAKGHKFAQVVTQGSNSRSCRLYESTGYQIERTENVFHFWIDQVR
jgi:dTDP-4-amino-4,6-dideoxy-D-galactose acyltransferase